LTVLQYLQQQLTIYQAEQAAAQADLAAAQARLAAAGKKLDGDPNAAPGPLNDGDQKTLAKTGAAIAAKRAELAAETSPPDAAALLDEIAALIITQRAQQGTVLDDLDEIASARAAADAAAATHARAGGRAGDLQAAIAAAGLDDDRRATLKTAIAAAPLSTLKADATAFMGSVTVTNATARIGTNFPAAILTISQKRLDTRVNRMAALQASANNAEDALGAEYATDNGLAGVAEQKRIALERAQKALSDYVATAASRFAQAGIVMRMLDAIETAPPGTVADVLTDPEKAQLTALAVAGAAAEPTAATLDGDLNDVVTAESALDAQILVAIGANPDTLSTDVTVAARRTAITTARGAFTGALAAFAGGSKADLDKWEAAIPDQGWKVLLDYQQGLKALTDVSGTTAATLAAAMDTAENDYATALQAAAVAARKAAFFADEIALRQERFDSASGAIGARLPSAIRGDSY
jgi:hypothetical protein